MKTLNTLTPIFIIGAPKCASTALHVTFSQSGLVNYAPIKDTKYLGEQNFKLASYQDFFSDSDLRVFEADQNLAINPIAFKNITQNFSNPILIYVLRSPKDRFFSALAWLKKNGLATDARQAFQHHNKWLIAHGKYEENIVNNIQPNASNAKLILVSFEKLTTDDGKTLRRLFEEVNLKPSTTLNLIQHNRSVEPRSRIVVAMLRKLFSRFRLIIPKPIQKFIKNSTFLERALYTSTSIPIDASDYEFYQTIKSEFSAADVLWTRVNSQGLLVRT